MPQPGPAPRGPCAAHARTLRFSTFAVTSGSTVSKIFTGEGSFNSGGSLRLGLLRHESLLLRGMGEIVYPFLLGLALRLTHMLVVSGCVLGMLQGVVSGASSAFPLSKASRVPPMRRPQWLGRLGEPPCTPRQRSANRSVRTTQKQCVRRPRRPGPELLCVEARAAWRAAASATRNALLRAASLPRPPRPFWRSPPP